MKSRYMKPVAIFLVMMMLFSMIPAGAVWAETTVQVTITVNSNGYIETDEGTYPHGVSYPSSLYYELGYGYEYTFSGSKILPPVSNRGTIQSGSFHAVTNEQNGTISGGWFESFVINNGTITAGTFDDIVTNYGTITGGTFKTGILNYGEVSNLGGAKIANVGDLGLTTQVLSGVERSITVKQNSVDIPENAGKAGEIYNVAGFDGTLVGLYLLKEGDSAPTDNFSIDTSVFTPVEVFGIIAQYDFTMPDYSVTILAVFDDYKAPTSTTYTVTYTDGVEDEEIFADVVYTVAENETVPIYVPPEREGFLFDGWNPNYTSTVTTDTTFTAKWREHISDGFTVTYTDGVADEVIFEDVVYFDISSGDSTPAYEGTPTRPGFTFAGWSPEVAATVTGSVTYTAQWKKNALRPIIPETGGGGSTYIEPKKTELVYEDKDSGQNPGQVYFKPDGDTDLPKDAELVVEPHKPGLEDLDFLKPEKTVPRRVVEELSNVKVTPHGFGSAAFLGPDGVEHTLYETIMIDGLAYYIHGGNEEKLLLYGKNGNTYEYDGDTLLYTGREGSVTFPDNEFISINGAVYQILYKVEWQGDVRYVLYLDGKPVGECYNVGFSMDFALIQNKVLFECFDEEYTPDRVKERQPQDENELGKIIPGADSRSGLEKGKTYEAYVIGAQEISVEGTDRVSGTIMQKFTISDAFAGRKDVQYVAVHTTESGAEFGEVTVSKDGKTLEAVYYVNSLSPFTVYAFVEQTERIVMQIDNTTILANGRTIVNDVAPVIVDNRTMVPIRVITETLSGKANWDADAKAVTISIDGKTLSMTVGQIIEGFDTAPMILNNRTYVPVRYVAEATGAKVQWEASTRQIVIEK